MNKEDSVKIFVINLKRSWERRKEISKKMDSYEIPFEFFDAVEGEHLDKEVMNKIHQKGKLFRKMYGRDMEKGEAGAAISHLSIYRKIINEDISSSIILEDDVDFDKTFHDFISKLNSLIGNYDPYELILIGYSENFQHRIPGKTSYWERRNILNHIYVGKPINWYWGAYGYLISKEGAEKMLRQGDLPVMQADFLTANSPFYGVKLGILSTPVLWPGELNKISTIRNRAELPDIDTKPIIEETMTMQRPNNISRLKKRLARLRWTLVKKIEPIRVLIKKMAFKDYSFIVDMNSDD